ncbi:MAG: hypothetical protein L0Z54_04675, partial [Thermoplasmata archaeon]|nr:hypothetical protein [Thermoplasmata archaeon]
AALSIPALQNEEGAMVLSDALVAAGRVGMAREVAVASGDEELLEWIIEETGWREVAPVERLVDLLVAIPGGKVMWRVRARLEEVRGAEGFDGLVSRLRERYRRRPALMKVLDDISV